MLRDIFETAVADGLIAVKAKPVAKIKNQKHQSPLPDAFDPEEKNLILGHMRERFDPQVRHYFEFAFHTGLRPSEQIAHRWPDVDWRHKTIRFERTEVDCEEKDTKTSTVRNVDLNDRALEALRRQKALTFMKNK